MNTANELYQEEKEEKYKEISFQYPEPERVIETKGTLEEIINPKIAYYKSGTKLDIMLDINIKDEEEKRKYYYLNKKDRCTKEMTSVMYIKRIAIKK